MSIQHLAPGRSAARVGTGMASRRCCACSSGLAVSVGLFDRIGPEGAAWLRLAWAGVIVLVVVRPRFAEPQPARPARRRSPSAS